MNLKAGYFERHKMDKLFANLMKGRKVRNKHTSRIRKLK